jgi:hypothetical protein
MQIIPEDLDNVENGLQNGVDNLNAIMQPDNPGQLQQQQPYFGAHLNFPSANLGRLGPNLVQQRSNLGQQH